jgi:hypothetical protein
MRLATLFLFSLRARWSKRVLTKFAAHQAAGFVGLRSRYGRCGRAVREGEKQPAFRAARSSYPGCLARHAGHRRVVKKAQALPAARRRSSLGRLRCYVGEGSTRAKTGSNPRDRTGRAAAERTSVFAERVHLRGGARNWRPIVAHRIAFARCVGVRCQHEMRKGQPSSSRACRHDRGVRGRFEEGTRTSKGG